MTLNELETAIEEKPNKERKKKRLIYLMFIILVIAIFNTYLCIFTDVYEDFSNWLEDDENLKEGIITLKYEKNRVYFFEINNETLIEVTKRDYLKYEVGDNYTYNTDQTTTEKEHETECVIIYPITFLLSSVFIIRKIKGVI